MAGARCGIRFEREQIAYCYCNGVRGLLCWGRGNSGGGNSGGGTSGGGNGGGDCRGGGNGGGGVFPPDDTEGGGGGSGTIVFSFFVTFSAVAAFVWHRRKGSDPRGKGYNVQVNEDEDGVEMA